MEGRSHDNKSYAVAGQVSYMAKDFELCSHDFKASYKARPSIRSRASRTEGHPPANIRVCIVGAGLAGLRCAEILIQAGVNVTLYEARDRSGGRVHQEMLGDTLVDMGPNWVHGTERNPIVQLARETGTSIEALGERTQVYGSTGEGIGDERAERLNDIIWSIISDAFAYSNKHCETIEPDLSLKDFFIEHLPKYDLSNVDHELAMDMAAMWGSFVGDNWDKQSLRWFWLEECLDGDNLFVVDTHRRIVDRIIDSIKQDANIKFGEKVIGVQDVSEPKSDPTIQVFAENEDGVTDEHFDEVVVAIPLGCLKRDAIQFSPPLPPSIKLAIENASISSLEKVFVTFPAAYWDFKPTDCNASNEQPPNNELESDYFPRFVNFLNPIYAPLTSNKSFALEVNTLSNPDRFGKHAQPTLIFSLFGDSGHELTAIINQLSPASQEYFSAVTDFTRPYYSRLPNYDPSKPECTPSAVIATNWQNDELAGNGSYTNFKVSETGTVVVLDDEVRAMRAGMPDRGIWLTGEHVAPFIGLGTSTGAYWSGEMAAVRILGANGIGIPKD